MSVNAFNPQVGQSNTADFPHGEIVLNLETNVVLSFKNPTYSNNYMKSKYNGQVICTNKRVLFLADSTKSILRDFSMPFSTITDLELKQPIFGQNYIVGNINAAPGGNWEGQAQFSLVFNHGGAVNFGQLILKTANTSSRNANPTDGCYPPPPPTYDSNILIAGAYTGGQNSQPSAPYSNEAPPSYDELQSSGYGVTDDIQRKNQ